MKTKLYLLPGWGADQRTWGSLATALSSDFELHFLDYGHLDKKRDDLLDSLAAQIELGSYVLGWSLGGMLALCLALRYPTRVAKLVTLASNLCFVAKESWPWAMPQATFEQFQSDFRCAPSKTARRFAALQAQNDRQRKEVSDHLLSSSLLPDAALHSSLDAQLSWLAELDLRTELPQCQAEVLMLFAEGDALVPSTAVAAIEGISIQKGTLQCELLPHSGHAMALSGGLVLSQRITAFLTPYRRQKSRIANAFSRAAESYDLYAALQYKVARTLCHWPLEWGQRVLDIGCGTGFCLDFLRRQNAQREYMGLDLSMPMLERARSKLGDDVVWLCADLEALPLASQSVDTLVSNLALQWLSDLDTLFVELRRVLREGGHLAFSSLGPDTLRELKSAWNQSDAAHVHVNDFLDSEAIIRAAEAQGFELEMFAQDTQCLYYDDVFTLMRELKGIGAHNVNAGSNKGLTGKQAFTKLAQAYEVWRNEQGKLPATYDVQLWIWSKRT